MVYWGLRHVALGARDDHAVERALAVAAGLLPFALLAVVGGSGIDGSLWMAAATLGLATLTCALLRHDGWRMTPAIWRIAAVFGFVVLWPLAVGLVRGAALPAPDLIGPAALALCGYAAAAILGMAMGMAPRRYAWFALALVGGGLAYALFALATRWDPMTDAVGLNERFQATIGNANAAACAFGMIGLLALGIAAHAIGPSIYGAPPAALMKAGVSALTFVVCLGAIGLTQSRFAMIATIMLGAWTVLRGRGKVGVPLAAIAVLALVPLWLTAGSTVMRFDALAGDFTLRTDVYRELAKIAMRAPWTGHGLGGFGELHVANLNPQSAALGWNWRAAHNLVLDAWLAGGIPFVLALGLLFVLLARPGIAYGWRADDVRARAMLAAAVLPFAFSIGDIALNVTAIGIFFSLLLGCLFARAQNGGRLLLG